MNGKPLGERITDLQQIKKMEVEILDTVVSFCNQHNLRYFLAFGTLLGAIRHQGFIPWDDDIDIIMPRPDYQKLLELWQDKEHFVLLECNQNQDYAYQFAKVCNADTFMEEHNVTLKYDMGLYIDIFPCDCLPDNEKAKNSLIRKLATFEKMRLYSMMPMKALFRDNSKWNMDRRLLWYLLRCIGPHRIAIEIDKLSRKTAYSSKGLGGFLSSRFPEHELMPLSTYENTIEVKFEGKLYRAPENYDFVLRTTYGNYMEFPPEEEQVLKHSFKLWKCR